MCNCIFYAAAPGTGALSDTVIPQRSGGGLQLILDVGELDKAVSRLFFSGIAASTAKTYQCGQSRRFSISPSVVSEETLCRFVAYLVEERLAYGTIKCYLSAVRHFYIARSGDIFKSQLPRLDYVLRGVKRSHGIQRARQGCP